MKLLNEDGIHKGHRGRMQRKFILHTGRTFDDYELLEMLLYAVIPYKDTNPIAKNLLTAFGGLDGVLNAKKDELTEICGIGESAANLILAAGRLTDRNMTGAQSTESCFDDYEKTGRFWIDYFSSEASEREVAAMLFDNKMNFIAAKTFYKQDLASAAVKSEPFIEFALQNRASVVITAHTHPNGPLYPTVEDVATNNMIADALGAAGVLLAEHFVIVGTKYLGIMNHLKNAFVQSPEISKFLESKERAKNEQK